MTAVTVYAPILASISPSQEPNFMTLEYLWQSLTSMGPKMRRQVPEIVLDASKPEQRALYWCALERFPEVKVTLVTSHERSLPIIVVAVDALLRNGCELEGIFRLTKDMGRAEKVYQAFEGATMLDFEAEDPFVIAMAIKQYTMKHFPGMFKAADVSKFAKTREYRDFLHALTPNRRAFLSLLGKLCRVLAGKPKTLMSLNNLARVFAPNLFQDKDPMIEFALINETIAMTEAILGDPSV